MLILYWLFLNTLKNRLSQNSFYSFIVYWFWENWLSVLRYNCSSLLILITFYWFLLTLFFLVIIAHGSWYSTLVLMVLVRILLVDRRLWSTSWIFFPLAALAVVSVTSMMVVNILIVSVSSWVPVVAVISTSVVAPPIHLLFEQAWVLDLCGKILI